MHVRTLFLCALLACTGCRRPDAAPGPSSGGVISLVPSATEILFALGAGSSLVGVSDYCTHPPEARGLTRYGGFLNPSTESILASGAHAIVLVSTQTRLIRACRDAGLEVVTVQTNNLDDMDAAIAALGELVGRQAEAVDLEKRIHAEIDAARARVPPGDPPRVVVVVDRAPDTLKRIFVAGPDSLLDDLLAKAGALNAFGDASRTYPMVSLETILAREPDVIIDLRPLERSSAHARERAEELWLSSSILAPGGPVRAIHVLEATDFTVYGPRLGKATHALVGVIHGGAQ